MRKEEGAFRRAGKHFSIALRAVLPTDTSALDALVRLHVLQNYNLIFVAINDPFRVSMRTEK